MIVEPKSACETTLSADANHKPCAQSFLLVRVIEDADLGKAVAILIILSLWLLIHTCFGIEWCVDIVLANYELFLLDM